MSNLGSNSANINNKPTIFDQRSMRNQSAFSLAESSGSAYANSGAANSSNTGSNATNTVLPEIGKRAIGSGATNGTTSKANRGSSFR